MRNVITAFKEHKEFKKERPWDANILTYPTDELVPPHYADTIEVLLCCNVLGDIHIGGEKFLLDGKKVFFIPPNTIHSINYKKNDGYVIVLKINVVELKPALDISAVLAYSNKSFDTLPYQINEYDDIKVIADIFLSATELTDIISAIMNLIKIILKNDLNSDNFIRKATHTDELYKIIAWTEEHFSEKISLDDAAALSGYAKNYFCNKFKQYTGITYLNYLNTLRIHHACRLLKSGCTIKEACEECGFENISYFIKLFKKTIGTTPKKYISSQA